MSTHPNRANRAAGNQLSTTVTRSTAFCGGHTQEQGGAAWRCSTATVSIGLLPVRHTRQHHHNSWPSCRIGCSPLANRSLQPQDGATRRQAGPARKEGGGEGEGIVSWVRNRNGRRHGGRASRLQAQFTVSPLASWHAVREAMQPGGAAACQHPPVLAGQASPPALCTPCTHTACTERRRSHMSSAYRTHGMHLPATTAQQRSTRAPGAGIGGPPWRRTCW